MVSVILQICDISDLQFNAKQYRYESWINATNDKYTSRDKAKFLVTKTRILQKHDNAKDITVIHVFFYLNILGPKRKTTYKNRKKKYCVLNESCKI